MKTYISGHYVTHQVHLFMYSLFSVFCIPIVNIEYIKN